MKTKSPNIPLRTASLAAVAVLSILFAAATNLRAAPLSGAIFSTDSTCTGVDLNIYASKDAVYIDGGPTHTGAAGLPPGTYCVQVTDPSGATVLGKSAEGAVTVNANGDFAQCYQLTSILNTASSGFTVAGYDDTANAGGEYKVWVSTDCNFALDSSKTDNFKVVSGGGSGGIAEICVTKYYDANANGQFDANEQPILGWQYRVFASNDLSLLRYTGETPGCLVVAPDSYDVIESGPIELNWVHTSDTDVPVTVANGQSKDVTFGNVCLGAGGGLTLGFWSNKNGQSLETANDFTVLTGLCLVNAAGGVQDFLGSLTANKTALNTWLLNATATNMAYMLSAQLATMELNVLHPTNKYNNNTGVSGTALVYAPQLSACGTVAGLNSLGFISINDLMVAANASLCAHPKTLSGSPYRACQEALKTALDDANNNKNFTQSGPCDFSFGN
jgi:hypothetical protein